MDDTKGMVLNTNVSWSIVVGKLQGSLFFFKKKMTSLVLILFVENGL